MLICTDTNGLSMPYTVKYPKQKKYGKKCLKKKLFHRQVKSYKKSSHLSQPRLVLDIIRVVLRLGSRPVPLDAPPDVSQEIGPLFVEALHDACVVGGVGGLHVQRLEKTKKKNYFLLFIILFLFTLYIYIHVLSYI